MGTTIQNTRRFAPLLTLAAITLLTACGDDDSAASTQISKLIGPAGGVLELNGEGKVEIPLGALEENVEITIREVKNPPPMPDNLVASGKAFAFEPHGLVFSREVKVTIPFTGSENEVRPMKLLDDDDVDWRTVVGADKNNGKLEIATGSFSIYQAARPNRESGFITLPDGAFFPADGGNADAGDAGRDSATPDAGQDATVTDAGHDSAVAVDAGTDANVIDASMDLDGAVSCTGSPDNDDDGISDACDDDIDGDGFVNSNDPDANNAGVPGDFSTVAAILADPRVTEALAELNGADPFFLPSTQTTPPNVSGYYRKADNAGSFTRTSNNTEIGRPVIGLEHADVVRPGNLLDSKVAGFTSNTVVTNTVSTGQFLRGSGTQFTVYSHDTTLCTINGASHRTFAIRITRGVVDTQTGDITFVASFSVTVATTGTLTTECAALRVGETENVDGWAYWTAPLDESITEQELLYLCVDNSVAYLPNETWVRSNGSHCICSAGPTITCE